MSILLITFIHFADMVVQPIRGDVMVFIMRISLKFPAKLVWG